MKRTEPLSLRQIIEESIKANNLEDTMLRHKVLSMWPEVVGADINHKTIERRIDDKGTLFVRISSSALRNELNLHRSQLIELLNKAVGKEVINSIRFL